jgi:hypothetical protein
MGRQDSRNKKARYQWVAGFLKVNYTVVLPS